MKTGSLFAAVAATVALLTGPSVARADEPTMKFSGAAAREVTSSLKEGKGWCIVSARQKMKVVPGEDAVDCVRYRVVTKYKASRVPDANGIPDDVVEVTLGAETDWIAVDLGMPKFSGPSLSAAKSANTAITALDELIPLLEGVVQKETDATVRAEGVRLVAALKAQRAALVDLIKKDIEAIGTVGK